MSEHMYSYNADRARRRIKNTQAAIEMRGRGESTKTIARALNVSQKTVESYLSGHAHAVKAVGRLVVDVPKRGPAFGRAVLMTHNYGVTV